MKGKGHRRWLKSHAPPRQHLLGAVWDIQPRWMIGLTQTVLLPSVIYLLVFFFSPPCSWSHFQVRHSDLTTVNRSSVLLPVLQEPCGEWSKHGCWWLKIKNAIALAALPTSSGFTSLLGFLIEFRTHTEYAETSYSCSDFSFCLVSQSPSQRRSLKDCYFSDISWLAFPGAILLPKEIQWIELLISLKLASRVFNSDWWFWVPLFAAGQFGML